MTTGKSPIPTYTTVSHYALSYAEWISPSRAFQEGQEASLGKVSPTNPYRVAMRSLTDPESLERLSKLATQWEDGYVSVKV